LLRNRTQPSAAATHRGNALRLAIAFIALIAVIPTVTAAITIGLVIIPELPPCPWSPGSESDL
jgi:hypothetical protein